MKPYRRREALCNEYHVPYYGPTQEDVDEAETMGDIAYENYRQQQLDDEQQGD